MNNIFKHNLKKIGVSIDNITDIYRVTNYKKTVELLINNSYEVIKSYDFYDVYSDGQHRCMLWRRKVNCFKYYN